MRNQLGTPIDLVALHEAANFQVETEHLALALDRIKPDSRYQCFGGVAVIQQVASIPRYANGIVTTAFGVEFDGSVRLQMHRFGVVIRQQLKTCVEGLGMSGKGPGVSVSGLEGARKGRASSYRERWGV